MAQTDADRAAGVMRFTFGQSPASCRALPNGPAHDWFRRYSERVAERSAAIPRLRRDEPSTSDSWHAGWDALLALTIETIKEWDRDDSLPSAEWLRENATASQLQLALDDMKDEAAGPFAAGLVALATIQAAADRSSQQSSTNGRSSTGDATPASSTTPSRRRK